MLKLSALLLASAAAVSGQTSAGGVLGSTTTNGCVALSNCVPKYTPPAAGAPASVPLPSPTRASRRTLCPPFPHRHLRQPA